jgi:HEAT repeat protein
LTEPDLTVRRGNAQIRDTLDRALLRVSDEVVVLTMMAALADRTGYVRTSAAKALTRSRDARAVGPLILALESEPTDFVRLELVRALGASAVGDARRRAIPALADSLIDLDTSVRQAAAREMERLTGAGIGVDPSAWLRWWKEHGKEYGRR